jgi:membrane protein
MRQKKHVTYFQIVKRTVIEFLEEGSYFHGAALSYYTLFALIPLLYLSLISFGSLFGQDRCIEIITELFQKNIGIDDIAIFTNYLKFMGRQSNSWLLNVAMIFLLLYSCSAFMVSLKFSINEFFNIQKRKREKLNIFMDFIKFRFLSITYLAFFALIIFVSYFIQIFAFSFIENYFNNKHGSLNFGYIVFHHLLSIGMNFAIISIIFKFVHDGEIRLRLAFQGALLTAVLLYLSQIFIKIYLQEYFFLGKGDVIGTLFILMAWVYYSSQVIFFGAKFTYVLGKYRKDIPE